MCLRCKHNASPLDYRSGGGDRPSNDQGFRRFPTQQRSLTHGAHAAARAVLESTRNVSLSFCPAHAETSTRIRMSDVQPAEAQSPKSPKGSTKAGGGGAAKEPKPRGPRPPPTHPPYLDMISAAITALKERTGSSHHAIEKWALGHFGEWPSPRRACMLAS